MRLYQCDVSGLPLYFDNHVRVVSDNAPVGFVADTMTLHTLPLLVRTASGASYPGRAKHGASAPTQLSMATTGW